MYRVLSKPMEMEDRLNQILGVVENGIFAHDTADLLILAQQNGVELIKPHI